MKIYNSDSISDCKSYLTETAFLKFSKQQLKYGTSATNPMVNLLAGEVNEKKAYYIEYSDEIYFYPNPDKAIYLGVFFNFPIGTALIFKEKNGVYFYSGENAYSFD
ncbi:hypothetical protein KAU32_13170 [bacterium]|nr:hypothetical protein [bacterium]